MKLAFEYAKGDIANVKDMGIERGLSQRSNPNKVFGNIATRVRSANKCELNKLCESRIRPSLRDYTLPLVVIPG